MTTNKVRKVVLAYSGGLDTSVIVPWLKNNYNNCEVICFTADVGQQEELEGLEEKALASGAAKLIVSDLREEFLTDYVFPTMQAGAVYEREYLLGTSIARPLMAKKMVEIAEAQGAEAVAHGCTGKGNDQVRFELTVMALNPKLKVIAPWREWEIRSREDAIKYAAKYNFPVKLGANLHNFLPVTHRFCRVTKLNLIRISLDYAPSVNWNSIPRITCSLPLPAHQSYSRKPLDTTSSSGRVSPA